MRHTEGARAYRNVEWIQRYCTDDRRPVILTRREQQQLRDLYNGRLADFVARLHRDGPERPAA
jgi:hypothetical protein